MNFLKGNYKLKNKIKEKKLTKEQKEQKLEQEWRKKHNIKPGAPSTLCEQDVTKFKKIEVA